MAAILPTALLGLVIWAVLSRVMSWRNAYMAAKSTGFPVFLSPVHMNDMWFLMLYRHISPLLQRLPPSWTNPWLPMAQVWNIWKHGHQPFEDLGTDTFILSTPRGNMLWTCDPRVCHQLETEHPKSQVAVERVKFFQLYGPNLASVEGEEWKRHRRVIMTGFDPAMNSAVWKETTLQTKALIDRWLVDNGTVSAMKPWTGKLALHVICAVFFRKTLTWPEKVDDRDNAPHGHRPPFDQALFDLLEHIRILYALPRILLRSLPFQSLRAARNAFDEWTRYLHELRRDVMGHVDEVSTKKTRSMIESIVLAGTVGSSKTGDRPLPPESILGNIFFLLQAGHETTGNTLAFALNLLAIYPEHQHKIHADLDALLSARPQASWTVEREYLRLQEGFLGAFLKEILRVFCVVQYIPRAVVEPIHVLDSAGVSHTIPAGTLGLLDFAAVFRDPRVWARNPVPASRRKELNDSPAIDFDPERWLGGPERVAVGESGDGTPPRHFPFGQGPHVCPGRLFALIEMTAVLATILGSYKLELVVDDDSLESCGGDQEAAWQKTRDQAMRMMGDEVEFNITITMRKPLPIRLVRRL